MFGASVVYCALIGFEASATRAADLASGVAHEGFGFAQHVYPVLVALSLLLITVDTMVSVYTRGFYVPKVSLELFWQCQRECL